MTKEIYIYMYIIYTHYIYIYAKRTRAPHTRVFGSSTPLCVAEEKTACHYNLSSLRRLSAVLRLERL